MIYDELNIKLKLHQTICSCKICEVSKFIGHPKKNTFKFVIKKQRTGRPLLNTSKQKSTLKICGNCTQELRRGKRHANCHKRRRVENIIQIAGSCQQEVAANILLAQEKMQNSSNLSLNKGRGCAMNLRIKRNSDKNSSTHLKARFEFILQYHQKIEKSFT